MHCTLATFNIENPLLWAVLIGWIMSVVLHEFAHGIVAHWGGDYTIRERGGLTLNPLQYVDPLMSLLIPAVILAMGGIPLPGGATYVRRDLLRSRFWDCAVSLAGPAMNLLLFFACIIPLHPRLGWIDPAAPSTWTNAQIFLGAMAVLQLLSVLFNLVPIPPLDGFQSIAPYLPTELRAKVSTPPLSTFAFFVYFMILWKSGVLGAVITGLMHVLYRLGYGTDGSYFFYLAYARALWGR